MKPARVRCHLLGCRDAEDHPACRRCTAGIYDIDYVPCGWLDPLFRAYWRLRSALRKFGPKRCEVCGQRYIQGHDEYCCSETCSDQWLPF